VLRGRSATNVLKRTSDRLLLNWTVGIIRFVAMGTDDVAFLKYVLAWDGVGI
jgi:hypothetical protein